MELTVKEANVLDVIATRSGMECWFFLKQDKNGRDYFYDIEEARRRPLKDGVLELAEGMTGYADYSLTEEKIETFENLMKRITPKKELKNLETQFDYLRKGAV